MKIKKSLFVILISMILFSACSNSNRNEEVEYLSTLAIENKESFRITPMGFVAVMDEDGYWLFQLAINNFSESNIIINMKTHLQTYYKDGENWYKTGNNVIYENTWRIPPTLEGEPNIWTLLIEPSIGSDDIIFRIFVDGAFEGERGSHIAGMVEYVIENGEVVIVNTVE